MGVLRECAGTFTTDEIAAQVIAAKGFETADSTLRTAIRDQLLTVLRAARKLGSVEQMGLGRRVRWKMST
jgi:hypothetical protein